MEASTFAQGLGKEAKMPITTGRISTGGRGMPIMKQTGFNHPITSPTTPSIGAKPSMPNVRQVAPPEVSTPPRASTSANDSVAAAGPMKTSAAPPNALTGNLGGIFRGPQGQGLTPPAAAPGASPGVQAPDISKPSLPGPMLPPAAGPAPQPMPKPEIPPPGQLSSPGPTMPSVADLPVDVSQPGMMGRSNMAMPLHEQFAQEMGAKMKPQPMTPNQRPVAQALPGGGVPIPAAQPQPAGTGGLVKTQSAAKFATSLNPMFNDERETRPEFKFGRDRIKPYAQYGNEALDEVATRYKKKPKQ